MVVVGPPVAQEAADTLALALARSVLLAHVLPENTPTVGLHETPLAAHWHALQVRPSMIEPKITVAVS